MSEISSSAISHVSLGTNNYASAIAFYDQLMPTVGCRKIMEHDNARAYGKDFPEFWIQQPIDAGAAESANGTHIAFIAASREEVDEFYRVGIAAGAADGGPPGPRPQYGEPYYACFLFDLDGHKIEAMYWDGSLTD